MPLSTEDWFSRVGIVAAMSGSLVSTDTAVQRIKEFTLWRYPRVMTDDRKLAWMKFVWPRIQRQDAKSAGAHEWAFWYALYQKKFGLYGQGWDDAAPPEKLIRHPFSLRSAEFDQARDSILKDAAFPTNVPDDRYRVSIVTTTVGGIGAGVATLAGAATLAVAGGAVAIVSGGVSGRVALNSFLEQRRVEHQMGEFQEIYRREDDYRRREVGNAS